jgi:hypothetical protein
MTQHPARPGRRDLLKTGVPLLAASVGLTAGCSRGASAAAQPGQPRLGINLADPVDWNTELPFVDVFRLSRDWVSQPPGASDWGKGPTLALDESGWIKALEPNCSADSPMMSSTDARYPAGNYTVLWQGDGEVDLWGGGRVTSSGTGRAVAEVTAGKGPLFLRVKKTNPSNPVRNIRVLRPGFGPETPANAFHDDFLNRWRGVSCIRFMDWQHTNNSKQASWAQRPKPTDARFSDKGVPVELMVDLCNRVDADPWFCMPHLADDSYISEFAALVKRNLSPQRKVYIEFSNELWNGMFEQARGLQAAAAAGKTSLAALVAERSLNMFRLWERAFGGRERMARVLPTQAAGTWYTETLLKHAEVFKQADVVASAPYLSLNLPPQSQGQGQGPAAAQVESWSLEQLFDHLEKVALPECTGWMKGQKALADKYGLKMVAYEGGQHLLGIFGAENNEKLTRLLHAANAHPRMGQLYERFLDAWAAAGGDLFCHFNSVSSWSKWGSWGLLRDSLEDPAKSPKFMATMNWARKQGQKVRVPGQG